MADPTAFAWAELGVKALGGLSGAMSGPPAGPSSAGQGGVLLGFDNSGWTVATSGSTAEARAGDRGAPTLAGTGALIGGSGGQGINWTTLAMVGLAVVAVLAWRKR